MILYNASTSDGLANYTRFLTNTNTTTYTANDLTANLNMWYHNVVNEILKSMDEWDFQGEYATASMVANQQEYILPTDILKIKRVEVTYDGTNWYQASFFDINQRTGATDATTINEKFNTSQPYVDLMDNSIFLYPIPTAASTNGIKVWYEKEATELSSNTDEPGFAEAYQKVLCYGAAKDYFEKYSEKAGSTNKRNLMQQNVNRMMEDLADFYNTKNQDRDYIIQPSYTNYE